MKPKFIVIDEWAALMAKIDSDYRLQAQVTEYLTQLVLEGRQSGVFIIFAMQRPDGEYIKTALRDNFMKRLSVMQSGIRRRINEVYKSERVLLVVL